MYKHTVWICHVYVYVTAYVYVYGDVYADACVAVDVEVWVHTLRYLTIYYNKIHYTTLDLVRLH